MTALTSPTGPLPARVYWVRRMMVFGTLFLVVFGTARIIAPDEEVPPGEQLVAVAQESEKDAKADADGKASDAGASGVSSEPSAEPSAEPSTAPSASPSATPTPTPTETPKPLPVGECSPADIKVVPQQPALRTSLKVTFGLTLTTAESPACTFTVSSDSVTMKIDSGKRERPDVVWQSQHCTDAIPTQEVTVYKDHETTVPVVWSGRRSDSDCSTDTSWAQSGWYHAQAATYGGEPTDVQFELTRLQPVTVTRTVAPEPEPSENPSESESEEGAVEPDLD